MLLPSLFEHESTQPTLRSPRSTSLRRQGSPRVRITGPQGCDPGRTLRVQYLSLALLIRQGALEWACSVEQWFAPPYSQKMRWEVPPYRKEGWAEGRTLRERSRQGRPSLRPAGRTERAPMEARASTRTPVVQPLLPIARGKRYSPHNCEARTENSVAPPSLKKGRPSIGCAGGRPASSNQ